VKLHATCAAAALHALPALAPVSPPVARVLGIPRTLPVSGVVLSFDDGPHPAGTPAVLDVLAAASARAVFFFAGEQVERDGALAREVAAAGHIVGVHCWRHRNMLRLTARQISDDLCRAREVIGAACGEAPQLHRPPYGIYSSLGLALVRRLGLRPLLWSRWGFDWRAAATAQSIATKITCDLRAGDVLLLHDADHYSTEGSWRATVAALPLVLGRIEAAGLRASP
jgi:peptidoglycan-N-acetylglucosamine deacetylase